MYVCSAIMRGPVLCGYTPTMQYELLFEFILQIYHPKPHIVSNF